MVAYEVAEVSSRVEGKQLVVTMNVTPVDHFCGSVDLTISVAKPEPICGKPTGVYNVTCARPLDHDGGCVGPIYVNPA